MKKDLDSHLPQSIKDEHTFIIPYIFIWMIVFVLFSLALQFMDNQAVRHNEHLFNQQQGVQTLLSAQAISNHLNLLIDETAVLLRSSVFNDLQNHPETLTNTFKTRLEANRQLLAYLYLENPGQINISATAATPAGREALRVAQEWGRSMEPAGNVTGTYLIPPFHITQEYRMLGVIYPFTDAGQQRTLIAVIDLQPLLQEYVIPLRSGKYGSGYALDGQGNILYDAETQIIGDNVFNGMHADYPSVQQIDARLISEDAGAGEYQFTVERGGAVQRKLIAWHTVHVGDQRLVVALSAPDSEIDAAMSELRKQRLLLAGTLVLAMALVSGFLFYRRQQSLAQSAQHLQTLVQERTAELSASEERYRTITELTPDGIWVHYKGEVLFTNPAGARLLGMDMEQILDSATLAHLAATPEAQPPDQMSHTEVNIPRPDGTRVCMTVSTAPIKYQKQQATLSIVRDITQHRLAEAERERLLNAERQQRLLAETLTEVTLMLTSQTQLEAVIEQILHQVQRIVPFSTANIMLLEGRKLRVVRSQGYERYNISNFMDGLELSLDQYPLDIRVLTNRELLLLRRPQQHPGWVVVPETAWIQSVVMIPICLRNRTLGILHLDGDRPDQFSEEDLQRLQPLANAAAIAIENARLVSELETEVAARSAEIIAERDKSEAILHTVGDAIAVLGNDLCIQYVNDAFITLTGYTREVILGQPLTCLRNESDPNAQPFPAQPWETLHRAMAEGEGWEGELTLQQRTGRIYEARMVIAPLHDAQGGLMGYVVSHQDISRFKALDRARRHFIFHTSQQLRTPITTLELYLHLLRQRDTSAENRTYLDALGAQVTQLSHLMQDILEITALDSGDITMEWLPISPSYVLGSVELNYRDQALTLGLEMTVDPLPANLPLIKGHAGRLSQAIGEIVENALIFTPRGGKINIAARAAVANGWSWLTITISDTGPGLTAEEQERLFERFFRGRLTEAGNIPGAGLGLSIAQEIAHAHGGRITVESRLNAGSAFTFWLPATQHLSTLQQ